jgi:hypothetical protein
VQARLESPTGCKDIELLLRPWLRRQAASREPNGDASAHMPRGISPTLRPSASLTDGHGQRRGAETAQ